MMWSATKRVVVVGVTVVQVKTNYQRDLGVGFTAVQVETNYKRNLVGPQ